MDYGTHVLISVAPVSLGYGIAGGMEVSGLIAMVVTGLLSWGGMRGELAVAMAMSLPDGPEKAVILHMTYGVVTFSIRA